jgi:phospholipid transport system substrate-binding protein
LLLRHAVKPRHWLLITDVAVDRVSMKITQRNEFAAIVQRNGGHSDALIAALREEAEEMRQTGSGV